MANNSANTSPLFTAVPDQRRYPILAGSVETDSVVVGAGIAGVMAAWRLAQHGRRVVLMEQNHVATGDTGYTTSFITRVPDTPLKPLVDRYGFDTVRRIFLATGEAQSYLEETIRSERIDCGLVSCPSYNCSYDVHSQFLRDEWTVVQQVDPQASFVKTTDDPNLHAPITEAIRFDQEGYFNVRQLIFALLQSSSGRRIKVYEESPVININNDKGRVVVKTKQGQVIGQNVLVTTGLPQPNFPELQKLFTSSVTYALAAKYEAGLPIADANFWDTDHPYQYYRRLDDHTMILGGADRASGAKISDPQQKLESFLNQRYPGRLQVTNRWSGSLFETTDGLPYIDSHPDHDGRIFFACGFGGSGMVMGTLSGLILGDLAAGIPNAHQELFSLNRTQTKVAKLEPQPKATVVQSARSPWLVVSQWFLPLAALLILMMPALVFFNQRHGLVFLQGADLKTFSLGLFPLVGLYAFTLVWFQLMIGSSMDLLRRLYPGIERYHRTEGAFVLAFALTHPTLLLIGVGWSTYWQRTFVAANLVPYIWVGYTQLFLICLTAGTALLRKTSLIKRYWRTIHYLNYAVFGLVWVHSWFLGSDVQNTSLRYFWMFFAVTAVASILGRIVRARRALTSAPIQAEQAIKESDQGREQKYFKVADVNQIQAGQPFCAEIEGKKIAVFKFGDQYYAIDNVCSHAGGPLCQGVQSGQTIECPLHQSIFDITTGAVKKGPAIRPQQTYQVRVRTGKIEIALT